MVGGDGEEEGERNKTENIFGNEGKMSDIEYPYVATNKETFEEIVSLDETDEAPRLERQLDAVSNLTRNTESGILKEQNFFVENNSLIGLSKLYSNRNYPNGTYISTRKEKPISSLNENAKNTCNELNDNNTPVSYNEENSLIIKRRLDSKKNIDNNSIVSLTKSSPQKEVNLKQMNGLLLGKDDPNNSNVSDTSEVIFYAAHVPNDSSFPDSSRKDNMHIYTEKEEVLKVVKSNKKARFKQFKTRKEAENFALNGAEINSQECFSMMTDNEKVMPFKRPKTEEIIQFRKLIEAGNIDVVKEKIFENPKYLVSNGDTPSILQEGSRYNALHIAAKAKNAPITRLILDTIMRIDFIGYLYDEKDPESCLSRSKILLDRYLNTPDKGANETPLHVAVKHGAVEVVQVLLSYSQCQKNNVFNKYNELPRDVICSRVGQPCEETKAAIASMLEEQYFVPVLRSEDNSLQPKVGEAFSITNPLKLESDLLSPRLEIRAYAGPMSKEKADLFKKKWKTPTRWAKGANSPLALRLRDTEKGLEKTGRNLATELNVPWQEYWSFLDTFVDISSETGLDLLEDYLKKRFQDTFSEVQQKEVCAENGESNQNANCPIKDLCKAFEMCGAQDKQWPPNVSKFSSPTPRVKRTSLTASFSQRDHNIKKVNEFFKNPIVYVERSCEVFGKRIGAAINSCVLFQNHSESLKENLETQVKHLQTLIKSYKEDNRFQSVDFQLIHSRVAAVAIESLHNPTERNKQSVLVALRSIDWSDGALSDDEDVNYNHRNHDWLGETTKQLYCLVKHLSAQLHEYCGGEQVRMSPSLWNEDDCKLLWAQATPCKCVWNKNSSKRGRTGLKRKQMRNECDCDVSPRKIQFDEENDDFVDSVATFSDENEDHFTTPSSGNSDSEEEVMEEAAEIPNTFLFPGSLPSKMDFSVLDAIDKVPLSQEKHPHVYLWRHILKTLPMELSFEHSHAVHSETPQRRRLNFDSPKSSPCKPLDGSLLGSDSSPPLPESVIEPWERITGPYSPRRSSRSSLSMLYYQDSPTSR